MDRRIPEHPPLQASYNSASQLEHKNQEHMEIGVLNVAATVDSATDQAVDPARHLNIALDAFAEVVELSLHPKGIPV